MGVEVERHWWNGVVVAVGEVWVISLTEVVYVRVGVNLWAWVEVLLALVCSNP